MSAPSPDQPTSRGARRAARPGYVPALAALSALAVLVANVGGIASGDDGVGYRATADSLLAGDGLGYFLERPLTIWPPVWPALMAALAKVTPLDALGAAILLNALVAALVVVVGNRLLRTLVSDERLVLLGTVVLAIGPASIGFGHLLMTDMAFALVVMAWAIALIEHRRRTLDGDRAAPRWLAAAVAAAWLGFGLRYVAVFLVGMGGLWLLLDGRRGLWTRLRDAAVYGVAAVSVPFAWMLRNHSIDGTFTGERHASARGLVDNGFDVAATLGRFLLPGIGDGMKELWAVIGLLGVCAFLWLTHRVLGGGGPVALVRLARRLGSPTGLLALTGVLYLAYMLYVRTTTALNQLDIRLLFPAYFPLLVVGLALVDRLAVSHVGDPAVGGDPWAPRARAATHVWAGANVIAGLVAVAMFAAGHSYFAGNYESEEFDAVRSNPALDALPEDCTTYSNLPNALYPAVEARWSPMRTALESPDPPDPADRLEVVAERIAEAGSRPSCLVWVDRQPNYGHLHDLDELERELELRPLAQHDEVGVYLLTGRR